MRRPLDALIGPLAVALACLGVLGVLGGCSDHDPLALNPTRPTVSKPTVPLGETPSQPDTSVDEASPRASIVAADGKEVAAGQVAAVAGMLSTATSQDVVMGVAFNRRFLAVQVQAIGFSAQSTGCVVTAAETAAGAGFASMKIGELGGLMGQVGSSVAACLGSSPLPPDLGNPDFSKVPATEVRAVLGDLSAATFTQVGLTADEATCVSSRQLSAYDDAELGQLFSTTATSRPLSEDVAACLSGARIAQLAGS